MALAKGRSRIRTGPLTNHTQTAIWLAKMMTKVCNSYYLAMHHKNVECKNVANLRSGRVW